ncbi:meiotic recombination protein SPO11-like isoform X2 [Clavelina lepadiformis]
MVTTPTFSTVSFAKENSVEKFGLILKIMSMIYKLLQSDQVATKRDLYYEEPHLFRNQTMLDHIIDDIACMLEVPRRFLNVVATSKGCVVGDLSYTGPDGEVVDCLSASSGVMIPAWIDKLDNFRTVHAKFVLVVEKDATFQRLIDDGLITSMPCVMITGKGVPDVNTRLMVKRIWKELEIPVFGLMDADPHGIEIMFVYRFGSVSQSFDATSLSLPFLKWIGIFASDIRRLQLPDDAVKALTSNDEMKCRDMLSRPYIPFHHDIQQEIHEMLLTKKKAEIQSLTRISQKYLSQVFIPSKIKHGDWI